jgi:ribosomal protein S18 acetylase RimI-like enzyme
MPSAAADVETLERATAAAVPPEALEEIDGWLLGFDSGTVGRAKSACPLRHDRLDPAIVDTIARRYDAHGLPPMFRIAERDGLREVQSRLHARGYEPGRPTLVQVGTTRDAIGVGSGDGVHLATSPDDAWIAAFLGEGFDPVDGASRARTLARGTDTTFASIREDGVAIGAGAASFGYGWASIHGMRIVKHRRGERIGARIIAALARLAAERAITRMFLQVEAHNDSAIALYRRAGFETAWPYAYWSRG